MKTITSFKKDGLFMLLLVVCTWLLVSTVANGQCTETKWYRDADGDGSGDAGVSVMACTQPAGYVASSCDPNDASKLYYCAPNGMIVTCDPAVAEIHTFHYATCAPGDEMDSLSLFFTGYQYDWRVIRPDLTEELGGEIAPNGDALFTGQWDLAVEPGSTILLGASAFCWVVPDFDFVFSGQAAYDTAYLPACASMWYLDADDDGHYISSVSSVASPGVGYNQTATQLGDCDDNNAAVYAASTWYLDADNDGYYISSQVSCNSPGAGYNTTATDSGDCDDASKFIHPGVTWYRDADGDGTGDHTISVVACIPPPGYVLLGCDPNDNSIYMSCLGEGAVFVCDEPHLNYSVIHSSSCDPGDMNVLEITYEGAEVIWYVTLPDGGYYEDGIIAPNGFFGSGTTTIEVPPGASVAMETHAYCYTPGAIPGYTAMGSISFPSCQPTWYLDADNDGHYISSVQSDTSPGAGYNTTATDSGDCDDSNKYRWTIGPLYVDQDVDGYNNGTADVCYGSELPSGYFNFTYGPDCDDANPAVHAASTWYLDADSDGYYVSSQQSCGSPGIGYNQTATVSGDCDDSNKYYWTFGPQYVDHDVDGYNNGIENVCYGAALPTGYFNFTYGPDCDDANSAIHATVQYYVDADHDTYGSTATAMVCSKTAPTGYSTNNTDCDDNNKNNYIFGPLYIDRDIDGYNVGIENVCYGAALPTGYFNFTYGPDCDDANRTIHAPVQYYIDADHDTYGSTATAMVCATTAPIGYSTNNTDCNDNNASAHAASTWYLDADNDGHYVSSQVSCGSPGAGYNQTATTLGDCNDADGSVYATVQYYVDGDHDNFGSTTIAMLCTASAPSGYSTNNTDCNDSNASVRPGATEVCANSIDDNCDGAVDEGCVACTTAPAKPGNVTGALSVCGSTVRIVYSVTAVPKATGYQWVVSGGTIAAGQGTSSIELNFPATYSSITIKVRASNTCGVSAYSNIITVKPPVAPATPSAIAGLTKVCPGSVGVVYSTPAVSGAAGYNWVVSAGTIASGQGTSSVLVNFPAAYNSLTVKVQARNACGVVSAFKSITVAPPAALAAPGNISGSAKVCPGTTGVVYSIVAVSGATGYKWVVTNGSVVTTTSGSTSFVYNFPAAYSSLTIKVQAINACGVGGAYKSTAAITPPAASTAPGTISGNDKVCGGSTLTYSIASVANAASYIWSVAAPAQIVSGQGTRTVNVQFPASFTSLTVSVKSVNACGVQSAARTKTVTRKNCTREAEEPGELVMSSSFEGLTVYPNPFTDQMKISFNSLSSSDYVIELMDITGRKVLVEKIKSAEGDNAVELNVSNLTAGTYLLSLRSEDGSVKTRMVINSGR